MKILIANVFVTVVLLSLVVAWIEFREPITADELARAVGARYWRYRIPASYKPSQVLRFQIVHPDGIETSGGASGFAPGEVVKVVTMPVEGAERLRCVILTDASASVPLLQQLLHGPSLTMHRGTTTTSLDNLLDGTSIQMHMGPGMLVEDGVFLKASDAGSVSFQQAKPTDITLRLVIEDPPG